MSHPTYNAFLALGIFAFASVTAGCAYPNQFRSTPASQPHATLTTFNDEGFFGGSITPFYINNQPTSFWRTSDTLRIRPGMTEVVAVYGGNAFTNPPRSYKPLRFSAAAGHTYTLRHLQTGSTDSAMITDSSIPLSPTVARATKEDESRSTQ